MGKFDLWSFSYLHPQTQYLVHWLIMKSWWAGKSTLDKSLKCSYGFTNIQLDLWAFFYKLDGDFFFKTNFKTWTFKIRKSNTCSQSVGNKNMPILWNMKINTWEAENRKFYRIKG